jgi:hypothetical protein
MPSSVDSIYTPAHLIRALARVKRINPPRTVGRLTLAHAQDGACTVTITENRREPALNLEIVVTLTADEVRAWRAACHAMAAELSGLGA